jgi:hypothetical protein
VRQWRAAHSPMSDVATKLSKRSPGAICDLFI